MSEKPRFYSTEIYPVYNLQGPHDNPSDGTPIDFTPEQVADFKRVNEAFWAWQEHIDAAVDRRERNSDAPDLTPGLCSTCGQRTAAEEDL